MRAAHSDRSEALIAPAEEALPQTRYSFDIGNALVYLVVLLGIVAGVGKWWGLLFHALYLCFVLGFTWTTLSRKQFERARAHYPDTNRETWIFNFGLFFVLLPLAAWLVFGLPSLLFTIRERRP